MTSENLVGVAYGGLYDDEPKHDFSLEYSGRLKHYNAHVRIQGKLLSFVLSRDWKEISEDIQIGLIQSLLMKALKKPKKSLEFDLYNNFVKKLHLAAPERKAAPTLKASFDRVNRHYFYGILEMPNLRFGQMARRTMGSYDFHTDTITISLLLESAPERLLDYIVYHELLHKKLKFSSTGLRTSYHSGEFRKRERSFQNAEAVEKELSRFLARF
jgi:predicted metal-dependent hydrolase